MSVKDWSTTAASNSGILSGITLDGSVMTVPQVDDAFREFAAQVAAQLGDMGYEGADIASATTTNLANATGWSIDITGTTTITGFGTVDAGQMYILRFTGILTLTHNATSLILPGGANITTAANDQAIMKSEGSGNWRCVAYTRASGLPVVMSGGAWNGTVGATTPSTGAFTTVSGTTGTFTSGLVLTGNILRSNETSATVIAGGTTAASGANIEIYGPSHATLPSEVVYDADEHTFRTAAGGGTTLVFNASTPALNFGTYGTGTVGIQFDTGAAGQNGRISTSASSTGSLSHYVFTNNNGAVGSISTNGSTTAFNTSSDERLKENFTSFDGGAILDAVNVYRYDWLNGGSGYGVKAQECHAVFPDAIMVGGEDVEQEPWAADYSKFVPLLIAEIKALRARVATLEA